MTRNTEKITIIIIGLICSLVICSRAEAVTRTWIGGGSDNLASNPANWSSSTLPQYGDDVVFNSTSINCDWDFDVLPASLSISSGYSGKVTISSSLNLTIEKNFVAPETPTGLNAVAVSSNQINLSWTYNSNKEAGFKIERKTCTGGTYSQIADVAANITAYSDTNLLPAKNYCYQVKAYNFIGESAYSNEANATTLTAAPTAVTNPATNVTHEFARLNGTVNPNGDSTMAYFELGIDTSYNLFTSSPISVGSGTNNVSIWVDLTGFSPDTTYHYRVVAENAGGTRISYGNDIGFTTNPLPGTIQVNAKLNGTPWTGSVSYTITGPETINGASAPATFTEKQVGQYTLTYNSGGPANAILNSITPSAAQTLQTEGTITFTLNFIYSPPAATTDPASNINSNSATLNATVNPHYFNTTVIFKWGLDTSYPYTTDPVSAGSGSTNVAVSSGITGLSPNTTYHYIVSTTNAYGTTNGNDKTFTTPPITLAITSPLNNDTINRPDVMVRGTVANSTGNETGVTVNGMVATVYNGEFFVNHVPLTEGSNTIMATATDTAGYTASTSITVNAVTTMPYVTLNANIESGIAPMTTYFSVSTSIPNSVATYQMDYEGDSIIDYTGTTFDNISHTYTTEGVYYPTITVTDSQSNTYTDTIAIVVLNATQLDTLLRAKWEAMRSSLSVQDTTAALTYIFSGTRTSYEEMFNYLMDQLPSIVATQTAFTLNYSTNNIAKYKLVTNEDGTTYSYEVVFIKDENGIWVIMEF